MLIEPRQVSPEAPAHWKKLAWKHLRAHLSTTAPGLYLLYLLFGFFLFEFEHAMQSVWPPLVLLVELVSGFLFFTFVHAGVARAIHRQLFSGEAFDLFHSLPVSRPYGKVLLEQLAVFKNKLSFFIIGLLMLSLAFPARKVLLVGAVLPGGFAHIIAFFSSAQLAAVLSLVFFQERFGVAPHLHMAFGLSADDSLFMAHSAVLKNRYVLLIFERFCFFSTLLGVILPAIGPIFYLHMQYAEAMAFSDIFQQGTRETKKAEVSNRLANPVAT